jgi:hypothetical protein
MSSPPAFVPPTSSSRSLWHRDTYLAPSPPAYFTQTPATADDAQLVLQQYSMCPKPGYDVVGINELSNPDLTTAFESRLRQLQSRTGKPAFKPRFPAESDAPQREAVLGILRAHAAPFHDASYPDVTIVGAWHGTDSSILPSIMSTSFANLATTDSGFFGSMARFHHVLILHADNRRRQRNLHQP